MDPTNGYTAEASAALAGPAWLRDRRGEAFGRLSAMALPSSEEEVWRYSRVADLDLDRYPPTVGSDQGGGGGAEDAVQEVLAAVGPHSAVAVVANGRLTRVEIAPAAAAQGVQVGALAELDPGGKSLGSVAGPPSDAFGEMHDAFSAEPVLLRVPAGVALAEPVVVVQWNDLEGSAVFPRLVVQAEEDSEVTVYDHHASADVDALTMDVVELDAGPAARLRYLSAQVLGERMWQLGHLASRAQRDATLQTAMVALGGSYARLSIDAALVGRGATGGMVAVYFGEGNQMHDFRTMQDHLAPSTTSNLLFKGALQGTSHAVYTGLIHIAKEAPGVNAFQTNRNIKLSDGAWAESVPNLEIENNDVHCSHASAIGPVDEDQRFYLESRGVPPQVAERLIVLGFFEEVLEDLPVPGAVAPLRAEISAKLLRRDHVHP